MDRIILELKIKKSDDWWKGKLSDLIYVYMVESEIPKEWLESCVMPLYKGKGNKKDIQTIEE